MEVKDAIMQQGAVKLRESLNMGSQVLAPNSSQPIQIDPVMSSYLDLSSPDDTSAAQVKDIQHFLTSQGHDTPDKTLQAMRDIETKLGQAEPGTRLDRLHRYVRLRMQATSLNKQAEAMER